MPASAERSRYYSFILIFVFIKIGLYLLAISNFGFQRDEFLYLDMAHHLDWGYNDVPPFIALVGKISMNLLGNSLFASRIFPTIGAGLIVWLTGLITVEMGGKRLAIAIACLTVIFSPAFAASGYLFEPVVFDQLWWVLAVWLLIKYCDTSAVKYLYFLGAVIGIGLLTKYTMGFFVAALVIGLAISPQRKLLLNVHIAKAALIAFILFLPNVIWQFSHHLPVINHMQTLRDEQLHYIGALGFILQQLVFNGVAVFIWLTGLLFLLFFPGLRKFQFLAFAFILIFIFYLFMDGKNYYLLGAYPMLLAAGGVEIEKWLQTKHYAMRVTVMVLLILPNLLILPIALPILSLNKTIAVFKVVQAACPVFNFVVIWDDNKIHPITQNYGDMLGWQELTAGVAKTWQTLSPGQQKLTQIYTANYGEAGAINHFGKQYNLPAAISLHGSSSLWAPASLNGQYIIYVDDTGGKNLQKLGLNVNCYNKTGAVENPLSVEKGTSIFLISHPASTLNLWYKKELATKKLHGLL